MPRSQGALTSVTSEKNKISQKAAELPNTFTFLIQLTPTVLPPKTPFWVNARTGTVHTHFYKDAYGDENHRKYLSGELSNGDFVTARQGYTIVKVSNRVLYKFAIPFGKSGSELSRYWINNDPVPASPHRYGYMGDQWMIGGEPVSLKEKETDFDPWDEDRVFQMCFHEAAGYNFDSNLMNVEAVAVTQAAVYNEGAIPFYALMVLQSTLSVNRSFVVVIAWLLSILIVLCYNPEWHGVAFWFSLVRIQPSLILVVFFEEVAKRYLYLGVFGVLEAALKYLKGGSWLACLVTVVFHLITTMFPFGLALTFHALWNLYIEILIQFICTKFRLVLPGNRPPHWTVDKFYQYFNMNVYELLHYEKAELAHLLTDLINAYANPDTNILLGMTAKWIAIKSDMIKNILDKYKIYLEGSYVTSSDFYGKHVQSVYDFFTSNLENFAGTELVKKTVSGLFAVVSACLIDLPLQHISVLQNLSTEAKKPIEELIRYYFHTLKECISKCSFDPLTRESYSTVMARYVSAHSVDLKCATLPQLQEMERDAASLIERMETVNPSTVSSMSNRLISLRSYMMTRRERVRPFVIVLNGPPGSGKTTSAEVIATWFFKSLGIEYDGWHSRHRVSMNMNDPKTPIQEGSSSEAYLVCMNDLPVDFDAGKPNYNRADFMRAIMDTDDTTFNGASLENKNVSFPMVKLVIVISNGDSWRTGGDSQSAHRLKRRIDRCYTLTGRQIERDSFAASATRKYTPCTINSDITHVKFSPLAQEFDQVSFFKHLIGVVDEYKLRMNNFDTQTGLQCRCGLPVYVHYEDQQLTPISDECYNHVTLSRMKGTVVSDYTIKDYTFYAMLLFLFYKNVFIVFDFLAHWYKTVTWLFRFYNAYLRLRMMSSRPRFFATNAYRAVEDVRKEISFENIKKRAIILLEFFIASVLSYGIYKAITHQRRPQSRKERKFTSSGEAEAYEPEFDFSDRSDDWYAKVDLFLNPNNEDFKKWKKEPEKVSVLSITKGVKGLDIVHKAIAMSLSVDTSCETCGKKSTSVCTLIDNVLCLIPSHSAGVKCEHDMTISLSADKFAANGTVHRVSKKEIYVDDDRCFVNISIFPSIDYSRFFTSSIPATLGITVPPLSVNDATVSSKITGDFKASQAKSETFNDSDGGKHSMKDIYDFETQYQACPGESGTPICYTKDGFGCIVGILSATSYGKCYFTPVFQSHIDEARAHFSIPKVTAVMTFLGDTQSNTVFLKNSQRGIYSVGTMGPNHVKHKTRLAPTRALQSRSLFSKEFPEGHSKMFVPMGKLAGLVDGEYKSAYNQTWKNKTPDTILDRSGYLQAQEAVIQKFSTDLATCGEVRPLTVSECLFGNQGKGITPFNRQTSCGFIYGRNGIRNKGDLFGGTIDEDNPKLLEQVRRDLLNVYRDVHEGKFLLPVVQAVPKDELREKEKVDNYKVRLFYVVDFVHNFILRMFLLPIIELIMSNPFLFGFFSKVNGGSVDWHMVYKHLKYGVKLDMDFSNFDSTHDQFLDFARVMWRLARVVYRDPGLADICYGLLSTFTHQIFIWYNDVSIKTRGMPSGSLITMIMNCIINVICNVYAFNKLVPLNVRLKAPDLETSYFHFVKYAINGDDNLSSTSEEIARYFNLKTMGTVMLRVGKFVTNGSKDGSDRDRVVIEGKDPVFLKRGFFYENGRCLAPLDERSIWKGLYFYEKGVDEIARLEQLIGTMNREYFLRGKDEFDHFQEVFPNLIFNVYKFKPLLQSYEELAVLYDSLEFKTWYL